MKSVAIVGVGLIGGSLGLALKKHGFTGHIAGVSAPATLRQALARRAIDEALPLAAAVRQADLVYLSQPIGGILDTLHHLDALVQPGALITDAGSTKSQIVALAHKVIRRCQFLGGHPMAGKEKRGVNESEADLFGGRTYVVTPASPAELETPAAQDFLEWVDRIGARRFVIGPDEHDRLVSFTSHLPQLAATALAATISENLESAAELQVAGPGLTDATRLALSAFEIWRDILATNPDAIDRALVAYIGKLEHLRENLRTRQMQEEFEVAARLATRLRA